MNDIDRNSEENDQNSFLAVADMRRISTAAVQVSHSLENQRNNSAAYGVLLKSPSNFSYYGFDKLEPEEADEYAQKMYMRKMQVPKVIRENNNLRSILSG